MIGFKYKTMTSGVTKLLRTIIDHIPNRKMSVFPSHFIHPVFNKSEQSELRKSGKIFKLNHLPTKPAQNDDSISIFHNVLLNKIMNYVTKNGNKKLSRELVEKSLECIKRIQIERSNLSTNLYEITPELVLIKAIENCRPLFQLTSVKRGGVRYQVPVPVNEKRSYILAMKWLLDAGKEKESRVHFPEKFAWEVLDAACEQGRVIKRKHDLHRQCEANRAYAHYRWS